MKKSLVIYNQLGQWHKSRLCELAVLGLINFLSIGTETLVSSRGTTLAQITPDTTLGVENSVNNNNVIEQGARRGANLFHSFLEFNVGEGQKVYFANPDGVENIIGRVTGSSPSNILGTLGVKGDASLFLINPKGIIFGSHASLDLRGSLIASTASIINFADGTQFIATNRATTPLLTISVPNGLQFGESAGQIINRSQATPTGVTNLNSQPLGLQVQPGRTLALVGSGVTLENGNLNASGVILENNNLITVSDLTAKGGRIEIGSVAAGSNLVSIESTGQDWYLGYEGVHKFEDIVFQQAAVEASGLSGGEIHLQGKFITLDNSSIDSFTLGENGSNIIIKGSQLLLRNNTFVTTILADGNGRGGNLLVTASEFVEVSNPGGFFTQTFASGVAGDINIETGQLILKNGGSVGASTFADGDGGNVSINALESVEATGIGTTPDGTKSSGLFTQVNEYSAGDAGKLTVNTRRLTVRNGATISVGTLTGSTGQGGILNINASESVEVNGTTTDEDGQNIPSSLFSASQGSGNAGQVTIEADKLIVRNGAEVTVSSQGTGDAGNLRIQARSVNLNNQGKLTATSASGEGGNISVQSQNVQLRQGSNISTTAGTEAGPGNGGNITIDTGTLVGLENSDITANAFRGKGGTIDITAQGIFGLVQLNFEDLNGRDPDEVPSSDITAISQTSPSLRGQVTINRPEFDPNQGLVTLPSQPVNVTGLIAQGCPEGGERLASQFVVTGRGGLPDNPGQTLSSDTVWSDLRSPTRLAVYRPSSEPATQPTNSTTEQLVEAQGWTTNDKGEVVLTAAVPSTTPHSPWMSSTGCHAP